jgi:hypothetical protein
MDLCVEIATGKCAVVCLGLAQFRQKKRRTQVRLFRCHKERVGFRLRRTRMVRHSAGWAACPTAALFSDALIDSRIGRTTNRAMTTTMKFMIAAIANTECQLPL